MSQRRRFPPEFKRQAVERLTAAQWPVAGDRKGSLRDSSSA
jgi:hypothetical protein